MPLKEQSRLEPRAVLDVRDLHVDFRSREGTVHAASGVTFHVNEGETLGIVGESGSGKSVTAQAALGIIPRPGRISSGQVIWHHGEGHVGRESFDIAEQKPQSDEMYNLRRREISLIMQEPMSAFSPVHTIGNQIVERLRLASPISKRDARLKVVDLLRSVGIPDPARRIDSYTFELSGGMRQRAMIAMALSTNPRLLIADEPTTAVDVTIQAQILRLLRDLQQERQMAILMITHDLAVVATVAHRVAVMYRGQIVEQGPVRDILNDPKHPYTQGLLSSASTLNDIPGQRVPTIPGVVPHPFEIVSGCHFHPRCGKAIVGLCNRRVPSKTDLGHGREVRCLLFEEGK